MRCSSHLQHTNEHVSEIVKEYFSEVNLEGSTLYVNRNEYEETMQAINNAVLKSIMAEEQSIQESFPHYFEKYRTDGVEYTIYIGQSISPEVKFDMMYLQNLRLWQIKSMAEVARITHNLMPSFGCHCKLHS